MKFSIFFLIFWTVIQKLVFAEEAYVLDSEQSLELTEANLKLLAFRLTEEWVDMTLEYNQSPDGSVQWFALGFGEQMSCSYAIIFQPQLDQDTITDVLITERQLGNYEPGRELPATVHEMQMTITQDPLAMIRVRLLRQREINNSASANVTTDCSNVNGYYQFPFNEEDISIIFAKGVNVSLAYHTASNRNLGVISLKAENVSTPINATTTCPQMFSLSNYTYAQRFSWPYVPRVCGSCMMNNDTNMTETLVPISTTSVTSIIGTNIQSGINSFFHDDFDENNFECIVMSNENNESSIPPVCGCANELSTDISILFLVDGAGNQNDSDWTQFTWKILEGFLMDVMMISNMNTSAITFTTMDPNMTMNNTILDEAEVNIVVYGGQQPLEVKKLDEEFLQNSSSNPIPMNERMISNLCNATKFAAAYLMNSTRNIKILVTIPWQDPSDELECILCNECTLNGINTFTAKIFDDMDLSLLENTFGGYSNCTYLYDNKSESEVRQLQEWPYVLAGISDFVCFMSQSQIVEVNFSLELLMVSGLPADMLVNYMLNISALIETAFEDASNETLMADSDFHVIVNSINETDVMAPIPTESMFTVMIDATVIAPSNEIKDMLIALAQGDAFSQLLNNSFYLLFQSVGGNAMVYVYSVDNVLFFNVSEFSTTQIGTTQFGTTQSILNTTGFLSTLLPELNMTTSEPTDSITDKAKKFFDELVPWMIAVIVIGAVLLCLLLVGSCMCCCRKNRNQEMDKDTKEQMPMITTNTVASQYIENTKSNKTHKPTSVPDDDDDQIYV